MELLEREQMLSVLDGCLAEAAAGSGRLALLAGEAGVGKTALARVFCARQGKAAHRWWGTCDALVTPSPLGPLHDIARQSGGALAQLLAADRPRHELFAGFLDTLTSPQRPVIVVLEDLHWADGATLDLLVFLARRVGRSNALVLATHRDDELPPAHPLRAVLGNLATVPQVRRLPVPPLSAEATARMVADHPVDAAHVYRVTGGNPFFVSELLTVPSGTVPETVRDAVLSRVAQLSGPARAALAAVAIVPDRVELPLVAAVTGAADAAAIEECEQAGLLQVAGRTVGFRHELARQAVERAIPAVRVPDLHAAALAHLARWPGADPARLAYHAELAGDPAAVLRHAPAAAAHASRLGAHREAAAHYRRTLPHAATLPAPERADLLERYAEECGSIGQQQDGLAALEQVAALRQECGDGDGRARAMVRRAQFLYTGGRGKEAFAQVDQALAMVAGRPPSAAVAAVYGHAAYLYMAQDDEPRALEFGNQAVAMAEQFDEPVVLSAALQAIGGVQWFSDPVAAEEAQTRAVEAAHAAGRAAGVGRATGGLGQGALNARRYRTADHWLARAVGWCEQHDLDAQRDFYRAAQAESGFEQGRWPQALEITEQLTASAANTFAPARILAQRIRCRLAVRRGEAEQQEPLARAWQAATASGDLARLWPTAAARAESAWLAGQAEQIPDLVAETFQLAVEKAHPWAVGELAFWLWRTGRRTGPPEGAADPYAWHMRGEFATAAAAWDAIGCPYEAATARADSDDPDQLRAALEAFYRLGARPAANRLVHRLRRLGITGLPRRPHRSTGANPAGLTDRELEVAVLLVSGMSNSDIAARLHISPRTAGHHLAAIMTKLGVTGRGAAAEAARAAGVAPAG